VEQHQRLQLDTSKLLIIWYTHTHAHTRARTHTHTHTHTHAHTSKSVLFFIVNSCVLITKENAHIHIHTHTHAHTHTHTHTGKSHTIRIFQYSQCITKFLCILRRFSESDAVGVLIICISLNVTTSLSYYMHIPY